jgi:cell shape-determining protein MreC
MQKMCGQLREEKMEYTKTVEEIKELKKIKKELEEDLTEAKKALEEKVKYLNSLSNIKDKTL